MSRIKFFHNKRNNLLNAKGGKKKGGKKGKSKGKDKQSSTLEALQFGHNLTLDLRTNSEGGLARADSASAESGNDPNKSHYFIYREKNERTKEALSGDQMATIQVGQLLSELLDITGKPKNAPVESSETDVMSSTDADAAPKQKSAIQKRIEAQKAREKNKMNKSSSNDDDEFLSSKNKRANSAISNMAANSTASNKNRTTYIEDSDDDDFFSSKALGRTTTGKTDTSKKDKKDKKDKKEKKDKKDKKDKKEKKEKKDKNRDKTSSPKKKDSKKDKFESTTSKSSSSVSAEELKKKLQEKKDKISGSLSRKNSRKSNPDNNDNNDKSTRSRKASPKINSPPLNRGNEAEYDPSLGGKDSRTNSAVNSAKNSPKRGRSTGRKSTNSAEQDELLKMQEALLAQVQEESDAITNNDPFAQTNTNSANTPSRKRRKVVALANDGSFDKSGNNANGSRKNDSRVSHDNKDSREASPKRTTSRNKNNSYAKDSRRRSRSRGRNNRDSRDSRY